MYQESPVGHSYLRLNGNEAGSPEFPKTVPPLLWVHSKIVYCSTLYGYVFTIQFKSWKYEKLMKEVGNYGAGKNSLRPVKAI